MKTRLALPLFLILALAAPVAASVASPSDNTASVAKKKKKATWCEKKVKSQIKYDKKAYGVKTSYKRLAIVKSMKFSLYTRRIKKRPADEYFFCSELPKFTGVVAESYGINKTSHVRAVKNNCALWYTEQAKSTRYDSNWKYIKIVPYKFFRKGSKYPKQTQATRLGTTDEVISVKNIAVAKNCVWAVGYTKNGAPSIAINASGDFADPGLVELSAPGATDAELKAIKVTYDSATRATVSWNQAGVPKTYVYGD